MGSPCRAYLQTEERVHAHRDEQVVDHGDEAATAILGSKRMLM